MDQWQGFIFAALLIRNDKVSMLNVQITCNFSSTSGIAENIPETPSMYKKHHTGYILIYIRVRFDFYLLHSSIKDKNFLLDTKM